MCLTKIEPKAGQYRFYRMDMFGDWGRIGQRDVRRLLVTGAMSVVSAAQKKGRCDDPWLADMLKRKPHMVVCGACKPNGTPPVGP